MWPEQDDKSKEETSKKAVAEELTDIVMGYDFFAAKEKVSDVRYMVEELNEFHYGAFSSNEKREELREYFQGLSEYSNGEEAREAFRMAVKLVDDMGAKTLTEPGPGQDR